MTYGFITVVEVPELGYSGGLLILRDDGKPVEFHCTAPVSENRAQQILYGSTYKQFVFCDQIGNALLKKSNSQTDFILTDQPELVALGDELDHPLVLVSQTADEALDNEPTVGASKQFRIADLSLKVSDEDLQKCHDAHNACQQFATKLPLDEPFERIRQAIDEAQAVAR